MEEVSAHSPHPTGTRPSRRDRVAIGSHRLPDAPAPDHGAGGARPARDGRDLSQTATVSTSARWRGTACTSEFIPIYRLDASEQRRAARWLVEGVSQVWMLDEMNRLNSCRFDKRSTPVSHLPVSYPIFSSVCYPSFFWRRFLGAEDAVDAFMQLALVFPRHMFS